MSLFLQKKMTPVDNMWKVKIKNKKTTRVSGDVASKLQLGDIVHSVAQPIAGAIDKTLGTNIKGCGACAKRRDKLNNLFNKDT